jgi:hypothetical protein
VRDLPRGRHRVQDVPDVYDKCVETIVDLQVKAHRVSASLQQIVVAGALASPQKVHTDAKSNRALRLSVASQSQWIEQLHEQLSGEKGIEMVLRASKAPG